MISVQFSMWFLVILSKILSYAVEIHVLFNINIKRAVYGIMMLGLYSIAYLCKIPLMQSYLGVELCVFFLIFFIIEGNVWKRIDCIVKSFLILLCIDALVEEIVLFIIVRSGAVNPSEQLLQLNKSIFEIGIWWILLLIKKMGRIEKKYVDYLLSLVVYGMVFSMILAVGTIQHMLKYITSERIEYWSNVITIISLFGIFSVGIFLFYVYNTNRRISELLENEKFIRKIQKNNYESMLAKEEETRKFRHDFSNHIMCVYEFINCGKLDKAKEYLVSLQQDLENIRQGHFAVGNEIIEMVLNYYLPILEDKVSIHVSGYIQEIIDIDNVELCSIISNTIQNAVEYLSKNEKEASFLYIKFVNLSEKIRIEIKNSYAIDNKLEVLSQLPYTVKKDKNNHGLGLQNVECLIKKNHGLFQMKRGGGIFEVILVLPTSKT